MRKYGLIMPFTSGDVIYTGVFDRLSAGILRRVADQETLQTSLAALSTPWGIWGSRELANDVEFATAAAGRDLKDYYLP